MGNDLEKFTKQDEMDAIEAIDDEVDNLDSAFNLSSNCQNLSIQDDFDNIGVGTIFTFLIDSSSSMTQYGRTIKNSFKDIIMKNIMNSKEADKILMRLIFFDSDVQGTGYTKVHQIPIDNYSPGGNTELYKAIVLGIKDHIAYVDNLIERGITPRSIFVIMTDGEDTSSPDSEITRSLALQYIQKLIQRETFVTFIGFGQNAIIEAKNLNFDDRNIVDITTLTDDVIKNLFCLISKSSINVSKGVLADPSKGLIDNIVEGNDVNSQNNWGILDDEEDEDDVLVP